MSTLNVPGAQLFYEVSGHGPLLILIPGASGTGESFRLLARELIAHYQVVTYDRRGFSRSHLDGPQDYEHRQATDTDDVQRLIECLSGQSAMIFGNSSGAIVALEVLARYPERVKVVVAHEPPVVSLLPNAAERRAAANGVYDTYRKEGVEKAMRQFGSSMAQEDRQVVERAMKEQANEYTLPNARYWIEHELRQYPWAELDLDALAAHTSQLVLVGGRNAQDRGPYQAGKVLARRLGLDLVDVPGGHLGFMTAPAAFAQVLLETLKD